MKWLTLLIFTSCAVLQQTELDVHFKTKDSLAIAVPHKVAEVPPVEVVEPLIWPWIVGGILALIIIGLLIKLIYATK